MNNLAFPNHTVTDRYSTHIVKNQARLPLGFNAFDDDVVLKAAIEREAPWAISRCSDLGILAGDEYVQELARLANRHIPELQTHDRFGNRIDWVDLHPAWHELMGLAWQHEVPNLSWRSNEKHSHYARAVLSYLWNQVEQGTGCPTGMAYASHAGLSTEPALKIWLEKSLGTVYENSREEVAKRARVFQNPNHKIRDELDRPWKVACNAVQRGKCNFTDLNEVVEVICCCTAPRPSCQYLKQTNKHQDNPRPVFQQVDDILPKR